MKRKLVISIDVEALPARASSDHVDKLIWGKFSSESSSYGLKKIIEVGNKFGVRFSHFLDLAEYYIYGKQVLDVGQLIIEKGHDLQLHLHPEILPDSWWENAGLVRPGPRPDEYPADTGAVIMENFIKLYEESFGVKPKAFRAGSFRLNSGYLMAQKELGIPLSSNSAYSVFLRQERWPLTDAQSGFREFENGIIEFPVTQLHARTGFSNVEYPWSKRALEASEEALIRLSQDLTGDPIVVLMHSWALLGPPNPKIHNRHFTPGGDEKFNDFKRFIKTCCNHFDVVSFSDLSKDEGISEEVKRRPYLAMPAQSFSYEVERKKEVKSTQDKNLPDSTLVLLIGGMRCGSTGIYSTLTQHSEILASAVKEPGFFSSNTEWEKGFPYYFKNWSSYDPLKHKVIFEGTTHYSKFPVHENVPARISETPCKVKFLYSVRDPLDRIESHLAFQVGKGYLKKEKRMEFLLGPALSYSSYWLQVSKYLEFFRREDFYIFLQEDFKNNPENHLELIFNFLGVDSKEDIPIKITNSRKRYIENASNKSPDFSITLTSDEEKILAGRLKEDMLKFETELGVDTSSWSRLWGALDS